jgi:hypothetical protein
MNDPIGRNMRLAGSKDPLVSKFENRLGDLVGILSKFIIDKSLPHEAYDGREQLDLEQARRVCSSIIDEANILLGPKRAKELNDEFEKIIKEYFKEGS